jgi:hypothetical protein
MGFLSKAFRKTLRNKYSLDMPRRPDIFGGNSFLFGRKPEI